MLRDGASPLRATPRTVTVGGAVRRGSANAEAADEKLSGMSTPEDEDASFGEAAPG
jgi:hypothetical protein